MATIAEFPDEPKYTIKAVCSQTGILPVTLRAWERRHEVLSPQRAENHYRLYSDRDVALLRWIKHRVDSGISISNAVNELRELRQRGDWPDAVPDAPIAVEQRPASEARRYVRLLYRALIKHDEQRASEIMQEINKTFDLRTTCIDILTPTLVEIGDAWFRGEVRVTTEHFACTFLRGKLLTIMQTFPCRRSSNHILVGCAPNEQHEVGSLMFAVLLRSMCYQVEYLGPDVPLDDLIDYAKYEHSALIILAATTESTALELVRFNEKLLRLKKPPVFAYAGQAFTRHPALIKRTDGIYLGATLEEGLETCQALLQSERMVKRMMAA